MVAGAWLGFTFVVLAAGTVVVEWPARFGLLSYLHPVYWLGLGLAILAGVLAFLDPREHSRALFFAIAVTMSLYLFSITVFVEPNARNPDAYQNFADIRNTLARGRINFTEAFPAGSYRSWPASNFLLTSMLLVTGRNDHMEFVRFLPLVWPLLILAIADTIGSRFDLSAKQVFVLSTLWVTSNLGWDDYPAIVLGHTLYFIAIMVLLSYRRTTSENFIFMVLAGALVMTHAIIGLALVLSSIGLLAFRRASLLQVVLGITMMAAWYVHIGSVFITNFVGALGGYWLRLQVRIFGSASYETAGPTPGRLVLRYSQFAYFVVYALLGLRHTAWIVSKWKALARPQLEMALFAMLVLLMPIAPSISLGEGIPRLIVLSAVWVILLLVLTRPSRLVVVALLVLFPLLLPLVRFSGEGFWPYVGTNTLQGARFFATTVDPPRPPQAIFSHVGVLSLIIYFNPQYFSVHSEQPFASDRPNIFGFDVATLGAAHVSYFILNKQGHEQLLWGWGVDPFDSWPQTERGRLAPRLYDNGGFQIYVNPEARPPDPKAGGQ
jgi:hypothetical protein